MVTSLPSSHHGNTGDEHKQSDKIDSISLTLSAQKETLNRSLSGLMAFTFCFTVVSVFPSVSIGLDFGVSTGGSGVIIWSWIIGSTFNILS